MYRWFSRDTEAAMAKEWMKKNGQRSCKLTKVLEYKQLVKGN